MMNTGYKGKLDLSPLGYENVIVLGEIKAPPKNWRGEDLMAAEETSYVVMLDLSKRTSP